MKRYLGMFLGVATSAAVFGGVSYASVGISQIKASYDNIALMVNGQSVPTSAQPFIYKYNVYVPISTVGHALGAHVKWVNSPAEVQVQGAGASLQPFSVYLNGRQMPTGLTNGKGLYGVPANNTQYENATKLIPSMDSQGNLNFQATAPPSVSSGTPLFTLTPSALHGDFKNTGLYPNGQLTGYWAPSVLGQLYPGQSAIQWGVGAGQTARLPGMDYSLNGQYQTLIGQFAVDDLSRNFTGSVQLVFVGDGNTLGSTGWIQGGAAPTPFSVNVTGVQTLEIQYQLKGPQGTVYTMGQTYQAPAKNLDGTKDPIVVTDLMNAVLQPSSSSSTAAGTGPASGGSGSTTSSSGNGTGGSSGTSGTTPATGTTTAPGTTPATTTTP
ncbi:MAG: NPCBM/NEW2 domain-containing protein [Bacilli bacterium]